MHSLYPAALEKLFLKSRHSLSARDKRTLSWYYLISSIMDPTKPEQALFFQEKNKAFTMRSLQNSYWP